MLDTKLSGRLKALSGDYIPCLHIGIILLFGLVSYSNTLDVPPQFDDLSEERTSFSISSDLFSIHGFLRNPRWLADLTFALNRSLHGEQVLGYHLFNLLIHLSSAVVIYLLVQHSVEALQRSFQTAEDDGRTVFLHRFIPFAAAALFVCHPVQTQAVTFISQRYTSLATFLYLGSLLSYLLARLSSADQTKKRHVWMWGFSCFFCALLSMKSKEIAFTLPLMAMALEAALFRGKLLRNPPFLIICVGLLLVIPLQLFYAQGAVENLLTHLQRATSETQSISRIDYLLTQFRVVTTYLRLLILPINQNLDYDYPVYHTLFDPSVFASLLLHITIAAAALLLFIRSEKQLISGNQSAGISMRIASLGVFWFYLALTVESSLIPIRDVIFEHRMYLPSAGFFMAAAAGAGGMAAYRPRSRTALWGGLVLFCFVLTAGTFARNRIWSDELVLWQDVVGKSPDKARPRLAVGTLYVRRFMPEKALPHFVRAVELENGWDVHWMNLNLAVCLTGSYEGRCSDGSKYHSTVVTVNQADRKLWSGASYNNLGLAYEYLGNHLLARENYLKAVEADPGLDVAWYNLALAAARQNDASAVESCLKELGRINSPMAQKAAKTIRGQ